MAGSNPQVEHLLRRAGFGASPDEYARLIDLSASVVVDQFLEYERQPDDVDSKIGQSAYAGVATRGGQFAPNVNIEDARQRWLFRMIHTERPLQEKMALFWHHHFATAYSKIAGIYGTAQATKMMANKPGELPGPPGQLELFRQHALGSFRELLVDVARDPAMLVWLDGRTNTRQRPQENFGREIMELFTFGLGNYTEQDVYAAARVFTGWNLRLVRGEGNDAYYEFVFNANQHDTTEKTFTFPMYSDGKSVIPSRAGQDGMQDGLDFIAALARHPETARRLARKLWGFFVSEVAPPDPGFVESVATVYFENDTRMKPVVSHILRSQWFQDPANRFARYSWPVEYAVRSVKEVGWNGFSVDSLRTPLANMGQTLFEPPDVNGWEVGRGWVSSGGMLARMNFAATLATNQRFNLGRAALPFRSHPDDILNYFMDRFSPAPYDDEPKNDLATYMSGGWTGSDAQVTARAAGLARLIIGSSEYQFV